MSASTNLLENFVGKLLVAEGALVDAIEPGTLEVIAPAHLQQGLKLPEMSRLGFSAERAVDAQLISLESDWLERFGTLLGERGRYLQTVVRAPLPTISNPTRMLEHTIVLNNAVYRFIDVYPAWTRYAIFTFHYTAFSDEKRDGILSVGINLSNGSAIDEQIGIMRNAAITADNAQIPADISLPPHWQSRQLEVFIERALPPRMLQSLSPFINGLQRRMERDLMRLYDYYQSLRAEAIKRAQKHKDEIAREQSRAEAIVREYQAKVADLKQKYEMKITSSLVQTAEIIMPVQRIEILIKRRKGERKMHLDYNPLLQKLELLPCEYSFSSEKARVVCDDKLHIVSRAAHDDCARCGKEYCRACYPQHCPKCR